MATSTDLVPVFLAQIGDVLSHVCDARAIHAFLENGDMFANWIKDRIEKYQFIENKDFILILENSKIKKRGGDRRSKEYRLTLDMAKELAMVERNEKGRFRGLFHYLGLWDAVRSSLHPWTRRQPVVQGKLGPINGSTPRAVRRSGVGEGSVGM